ncbi:MAG: 3-oxoacyl-ACP reductase FabG [Solirubrobacteraceae bacterium]
MRPEGAALVTGSSRGLGAAIARSLASDGWPVVVNFSSDHDGATRVAAEIERSNGRATLVQADVSDPQAVERMFAQIEALFGPVLALVNNAGVRADALTPQLEDQQWEHVLAVNLSGAFRATRRALKGMLRARYGRIVNVASVVGVRANPGQANYAASKAGLIGFTRTVAAEVARRGVTVNAVAPGLVNTELAAGIDTERFLAAVPARRAGTPEEVAACVRFLASEEASYVTGATLTVDGGLTA